MLRDRLAVACMIVDVRNSGTLASMNFINCGWLNSESYNMGVRVRAGPLRAILRHTCRKCMHTFLAIRARSGMYKASSNFFDFGQSTVAVHITLLAGQLLLEELNRGFA
jgi:hypothetical protein